MEKRILSIKCPKCHTNKMIIASETIEATTDFTFENGICTDTNNEYGNGNKQSTNGVWLLVNKMEIFNEMIIKTGMTRIFFELKGM